MTIYSRKVPKLSALPQITPEISRSSFTARKSSFKPGTILKLMRLSCNVALSTPNDCDNFHIKKPQTSSIATKSANRSLKAVCGGFSTQTSKHLIGLPEKLENLETIRRTNFPRRPDFAERLARDFLLACLVKRLLILRMIRTAGVSAPNATPCSVWSRHVSSFTTFAFLRL